MQPARRVRRSLGRDHEEEGELGAGCGHPGLLWFFFAGMDGQVSPAPHRGPTDPPPDQEMAEGRRTRGWEMVGDGKRNSARIGDFAVACKCLPAMFSKALQVTQSVLLRGAAQPRKHPFR